MNHEEQARMKWVRTYLDTGDAGLTCRRCGISRPTLRKWLRRYEAEGLAGLKSQSKRPRTSPSRKVTAEHERWILNLRHSRQLGVRRIQHELQRLYNCHLSIRTIDKTLKRHNTPPLRQSRRKKRHKLYEKSMPGERVQLDTMKVAPGLYQYTAVDDFSRFLVAELYPRRSAANTLDFLELLQDSYAVPIQCIQTDRGSEFMAMKVQFHLMALSIKYRPTRPGSPHLNGKVERVQRTIRDEFYSWADLDSDELADELGDWVLNYNYRRVHSMLGMTPMQRFCQRIDDVPLWNAVYDAYEFTKERLRERNYTLDFQLGQLHQRKLQILEQAAAEPPMQGAQDGSSEAERP